MQSQLPARDWSLPYNSPDVRKTMPGQGRAAWTQSFLVTSERIDSEPHRRLERDRYRVGGAGAGRRLYAPVRVELELCGQSRGDEEPALRRAEGSQARRPGLVYASRAGGPLLAGGELACRAH